MYPDNVHLLLKIHMRLCSYQHHSMHIQVNFYKDSHINKPYPVFQSECFLHCITKYFLNYQSLPHFP